MSGGVGELGGVDPGRAGVVSINSDIFYPGMVVEAIRFDHGD